MSRALFWTIPFAATILLSLFLLYTSRKDRDKKKIMFALSFAFASVGYSDMMLQRYGLATLWDQNYVWSFVPLGSAVLLASFSTLLRVKNFRRPFQVFLITLGASILLLVFPISGDSLSLPLSCTFVGLSVPVLAYIFLRKRDISDLMFSLAFLCLAFSWMTNDFGLQEEITVLLTLFAFVFTALMFTVAKDTVAGDMASFLVLQNELEKTRQDLELTQDRAREELEASEERFHGLCDDARMLMLRINRKGVVTYVNRIVEEYGLKREDIIGKNMLQFIPRKYQLKLFYEHLRVIRGKNAEGETEILSPKGKLNVEFSSNPVRQNGKIVGDEVLVRDVTERKEMERKLQEYATQLETKVEERTDDLRRSEENLKTLLNSVHTGVIVVDPVNHSILEANATAVKMFGATKEKIIGATCHKFICPADVGHCPITDLKQTVDHSERKLLTVNGKAIPVIKTVICAEVGGQKQLIESFIDISDRKALEQKLALALEQQTSLMRSSAAMIHTPKLRERLQAILDAIHGLGWRRVVLSVRTDGLDIEKPEDLVTAGLTEEEQRSLWTNRQPGKTWKERFGPEFERFRIGEFYYLPWDDPLAREKFNRGTISSHLKRDEMIDWNPDDLLYAPLKLADGRIVAVVSMDDPEDGRRPTKESLAPLELFLHQAAVAIENAQLIEQLNNANANFYNAALIDYRLPDMEGTELLTSFRETTPRMVKIMVTGYPSLQNAATSVNKRADAFLMKPVSIETLLKTISDLLRKQEEDEKYSEEKVAEFIETRFRKVEEQTPA